MQRLVQTVGWQGVGSRVKIRPVFHIFSLTVMNQPEVMTGKPSTLSCTYGLSSCLHQTWEYDNVFLFFFFFWVFYSSPLPFIYFYCSFLLSNHLSLTNPHQNNWKTSWIVFMPTDSGSLPVFLELPCTSECLITKKITTFINWQTHNVFNLFKRKHPVNYYSSPSLAKDQPTNASGDRESALAKPYCHSKMDCRGRNRFLLLL